MRLGHLTSPHYSNILLISKEGKHLATIGSRRADWYVKKGLGVEVAPIASYAKVIQLTFEPAADEKATAFALLPKENRCVVCGSDKELSLHHVIPICVKRHFPEIEKNHSSQWCVLTCEDCHIKAEEPTRKAYESYMLEFSREFYSHPICEANTAINSLYKIKKRKHAERLGAEKIESLLKTSLVYFSLEEVEEDSAPYKFEVDLIKENLKKKWMKKLLEDNGGVKGVKELFKNIFLSLEPKFLPKGFLDIE
jgi:hypothetical protein